MLRALERSSRNLFGSRSAEAALAARDTGEPDPAAEAAEVEELRAAQSEDGSWGGDLVRTAESVLLLHELGGESAAESARRGIGWLRAQQDLPGRFAEGCDSERHALGICHHFASGFFAAAPPGVPVSGITLANGARIEEDLPARLAASSLALQAVLLWGVGSSAVTLHLDALYRLIAQRSGWADPLAPPAVFMVMTGAVLRAPRGADADEALARALELITRAQRADGTWPEADSFQALELLLAVRDAQRADAAVDGAIRRVARLLASSQQRDGSWGRETGPRRTYAAWRAMRYALEGAAGEQKAS